MSPWLKNKKSRCPQQRLGKEVNALKGYHVSDGYMGFVPWLKDYMLFACERDYIEYLK